MGLEWSDCTEFDKCLGSSAAEVLVKYQSDVILVKSIFAVSRRPEIYQ